MNDQYYKTNESLLKNIRDGDKDSLDKLVSENMGLVYSICARFTGRGTDLDDLYQIGAIALIKASKSFDPSYGVKFSTYAVPMIMGEIKRHIRDFSAIKASRGLKELGTKARYAAQSLMQKLGREPNISELAQELCVSREDVVMCLEATAAPQSLSTQVGEGGAELSEFISDSGYKEEELVEKIALDKALEMLGERDRRLMELRYFRELTQTQTAQILGISQVSVSRAERRALLKLREIMR